MVTGNLALMRPLREVLRDAGSAAHGQLDQIFATTLQGTGDYARLLQLLHSLHTTADPLLQAWVAASDTAPRVVIPTRSTALARDLSLLGYPTRPPIRLDELPRRLGGVVTDPAGLALLYVVAGSSIGARVILASLGDDIDTAARLGLSEGASLTSAGLWRQTLSVLSTPVDASLADPAAAACQLVFGSLLAAAQRPGVTCAPR